ncbi:hypothetical protein WS81_08390 [Burkholderia sp. MSMB2040]|nr:hypothetical protein WS81_08390 [Burkholderia sp. MSMB2040]
MFRGSLFAVDSRTVESSVADEPFRRASELIGRAPNRSLAVELRSIGYPKDECVAVCAEWNSQ